jgi:cytochrome P450
VLARLREHEPISWVPALGAWLVTRRADALAILRDPETFTVDDPRFSTARVVGPSMLSLDGEAHARHRAAFAQPFRLEAVRERLTAFVAGETDRLLQRLAPAGEGELRRGFAGPLAASVVTHALGLRETERVLAWYDAIVDAVDVVTAGGEVTAAGRAAFDELREAVQTTHPPELVGDVAVLLFGGIETTEGMIANALAHVLEHGAAPTPDAIEESLRTEPAAATVDRYATRDVPPIRAGDLVTVSIAGANRDPATFPDPDRFDPARANARLHLAFAAGPHVCLGMHLARLEAHTALARALECLPGLQLAAPATPRGLVFRKPPELRAVWS